MGILARRSTSYSASLSYCCQAASHITIDNVAQGLDLAKLETQGKLVYIDGLTGLFGDYIKGEGGLHTGKKGAERLGDAGLESIEKVVGRYIGTVDLQSENRTLLMLDGLDILLAATETDAQALTDVVNEWREVSMTD